MLRLEDGIGVRREEVDAVARFLQYELFEMREVRVMIDQQDTGGCGACHILAYLARDLVMRRPTQIRRRPRIRVDTRETIAISTGATLHVLLHGADEEVADGDPQNRADEIVDDAGDVEGLDRVEVRLADVLPQKSQHLIVQHLIFL